MAAVGRVRVALNQVKQAWRQKASQRGYHFGFNLKNLKPNEGSLKSWFKSAQNLRVESRENLAVSAYIPPAYSFVSRNVKFSGFVGAQELHWAEPGSHTGAMHAISTLEDFPTIRATLINHSEVIAEQGRTLEQAAAQLRMALDSTYEGRTFKFITLCVGEDRATYDKGGYAAARYVKNQVRTMLKLAGVTAEEMSRIGIAYEPRFAIQVGDKAGIPPSDEHIKNMGWNILQAVAEVIGIKGMAKMFTLQYGGSMKGPDNETAPVQRFVGPGNKVAEDLYNGGLIGTAGKDPATVAAILQKIAPLA